MRKKNNSKKAADYFRKAQRFLEKSDISDEKEVIQKIAELFKKIAEQQERQQREYQARLEEDKKQKYLGTMSAALVHEMSQPAGSIRMAVGGARCLLRDGLFKPDEIEPLLEHLWGQTERLGNIINTFQGFARGDEHAPPEAVNPCRVIEQTLTLFAAQLKERNISLHLQLAPETPLAWLNPFQLQVVRTKQE